MFGLDTHTHILGLVLYEYKYHYDILYRSRVDRRRYYYSLSNQFRSTDSCRQFDIIIKRYCTITTEKIIVRGRRIIRSVSLIGVDNV